MKIPVIQYAKQVIDSGELGEFVSFRGSYDTDGLATLMPSMLAGCWPELHFRFHGRSSRTCALYLPVSAG